MAGCDNRRSRRARPASTIRPVAALFCELLEARQYLAGTFQLAAGGLLNINGTSGDDAIVLSQKGKRLSVSVNGQKQSFAVKSIKKVRISCGDGNDSVTWARGGISRPGGTRSR